MKKNNKNKMDENYKKEIYLAHSKSEVMQADTKLGLLLTVYALLISIIVVLSCNYITNQ